MRRVGDVKQGPQGARHSTVNCLRPSLCRTRPRPRRCGPRDHFQGLKRHPPRCRPAGHLQPRPRPRRPGQASASPMPTRQQRPKQLRRRRSAHRPCSMPGRYGSQRRFNRLIRADRVARRSRKVLAPRRQMPPLPGPPCPMRRGLRSLPPGLQSLPQPLAWGHGCCSAPTPQACSTGKDARPRGPGPWRRHRCRSSCVPRSRWCPWRATRTDGCPCRPRCTA